MYLFYLEFSSRHKSTMTGEMVHRRRVKMRKTLEKWKTRNRKSGITLGAKFLIKNLKKTI